MEQYQHQTLEMLALPEDRALDANDKIHYFQVLSSQLWAYRFCTVMYTIWSKITKISASFIHALLDRSCSRDKNL